MKNLITTAILVLAFQPACFGLVGGLDQIAQKYNELVATPIDLNITPDIVDIKLDLKRNLVRITLAETDMKAYAPAILVASDTVKFDWISQF
jgi:hypothetical protein